MARSISFDILAVDKASRQLEEVGREVSDLAQKIDRADGTIEIDADTAKAQEKLRAVDSQLARLNAKSFKVDADTDAAERQLQILRAELERTTDADRKVKIEADIAGAQAKLRSLQAEKVSIDVDTGAAQAKLAAIKASIDGVDRRKTTSIDVDAASALGKLGELGAYLRNIQTPVTIGISVAGAAEALAWIQSVAAGLASIGAVGAVSGGIAIAAFSGVGDAVKAMGEKVETGGSKATTSASAIRSATRQVEAAQRDLRDANAQVKLSEEDLSQAQDDARRAVEALDDARKAATRTLEDYALRSAGIALSQESASLSVAEAQARLNEVNTDAKSTSLERARADLAVREALQRQNELQVEAKRLTEDKTAADAKGVEGSDQVVSAQDRIRDANKRVEDAQRQLAKSHEQVTLAMQKVSDAALALQEAMTPKGGGGGTTVDKFADAIKGRTPEFVDFVTYLRELIDGPLKELRSDAESSFLPGVQSGMEAFMANLGDVRADVKSTGEAAGGFFEDIGPSAGKAAEALLRLSGLGAETTFDGLADAVNAALDKFTEWANSQSAADIQADLHDIGKTVVEIKDGAVDAFHAIELAWNLLTFPIDVMREPIQAFIDLYDAFKPFADMLPGVKLPEVSQGLRDLAAAASGSQEPLRGAGSAADGSSTQVKHLTDTLETIPLAKATSITTPGATTSEDAAKKVTTAVGLIPAQRTTTVTANTAGAVSNVSSFKSLIDGLKDKAITVKTVFQSIYQTITGMSDGGRVGFGPGARSGVDSVPALLMPDEFVVRAPQARKYAALLDAINRGEAVDQVAAASGVAPITFSGNVSAPAVPVQPSIVVNVSAGAIGSEDQLARQIRTVLLEARERGQLAAVGLG